MSKNLSYKLTVANINAHLFNVELLIKRPQAKQIVYLPTWIAGSYLIREFAKHLQLLQATQQGKKVTIKQLDKHSWQMDCLADKELSLNYQIYAFDNSVRAAWLDAERAFFNASSLFLAVKGQEDDCLQLKIAKFTQINQAQLATALTSKKVDKFGFGSYRVANYQELIDCPVEISNFVSREFEVAGVKHKLVVSGAGENFDLARLTADVAKICQAQMQMWTAGGEQLPFAKYLFLLNVVEQGYGGLEHRNSCAMICSRQDLPLLASSRNSKEYQRLLGLISHEYFHAWNVKRLRPFERVDITKENYTDLLWFFEGITSYYDDLMLWRAGCISQQEYLNIVAENIAKLQQMPGRQVQNLAQASYDAWVKFYRPDENTANATVSYYIKGSLLALSWDLILRQQAKTSLDKLMQYLWQQHGDSAISYSDICQAISKVAGKKFVKVLDKLVFSPAELPLAQLLIKQGVKLTFEPAAAQRQLGFTLQSKNNTTLVTAVLSNGLAMQAGLSVGDEIIAINGWRFTSLKELQRLVKVNKSAQFSKTTCLVARGGKLHELSLSIPRNLLVDQEQNSPVNQWDYNWQWKLTCAKADKIEQWLEHC